MRLSDSVAGFTLTVTVTVTVTKALVLRPLLKDRGCIIESIRILVTVVVKCLTFGTSDYGIWSVSYTHLTLPTNREV